MSLNDIRKSSTNFFELHKNHTASTSSTAAPSATSTSRQATTSTAATGQNKQSSTTAASNQTTSPNELPPPSPASSVGSSAGSVNCTAAATSSEATSAQQLKQAQEIMSIARRYNSLNDYNVRSQTTWDNNERQIGQNKSLSGEFISFYRPQLERTPSSTYCLLQSSVTPLVNACAKSCTWTARPRSSRPTSFRA